MHVSVCICAHSSVSISCHVCVCTCLLACLSMCSCVLCAHACPYMLWGPAPLCGEAVCPTCLRSPMARSPGHPLREPSGVLDAALPQTLWAAQAEASCPRAAASTKPMPSGSHAPQTQAWPDTGGLQPREAHGALRTCPGQERPPLAGENRPPMGTGPLPSSPGAGTAQSKSPWLGSALASPDHCSSPRGARRDHPHRFCLGRPGCSPQKAGPGGWLRVRWQNSGPCIHAPRRGQSRCESEQPHCPHSVSREQGGGSDPHSLSVFPGWPGHFPDSGSRARCQLGSVIREPGADAAAPP